MPVENRMRRRNHDRSGNGQQKRQNAPCPAPPGTARSPRSPRSASCSQRSPSMTHKRHKTKSICQRSTWMSVMHPPFHTRTKHNVKNDLLLWRPPANVFFVFCPIIKRYPTTHQTMFASLSPVEPCPSSTPERSPSKLTARYHSINLMKRHLQDPAQSGDQEQATHHSLQKRTERRKQHLGPKDHG